MSSLSPPWHNLTLFPLLSWLVTWDNFQVSSWPSTASLSAE